MKILYDHQIYSRQNYGGISRYFYELSKGINRNGNEVVNSVSFSDNIFNIDKEVYNCKQLLTAKNFNGKRKIQNYLNERNTLKVIKTNKFDIFHPTYYNDYYLTTIDKKKPLVVTFFDLIHEKMGKKFKDLAIEDLSSRKSLINRADAIIAISNNTKQDIIEIYGVPAERINVTYLGNSLALPDNKSNITDVEEYILFVGNRNSYKNFTRFISAISSILIREKNLMIICAGGGLFTNDEKNLFVSLGIANKFIHKFIDDKKLYLLYSNALFFAFPSLYEGFGIPVLEAFACNCPIVLSNRSSLPEVGGEAVVYINPEDNNDMLEKVEKVLYDKSLRAEMKSKGMEQLKKFSWDIMVNETARIYKSIL